MNRILVAGLLVVLVIAGFWLSYIAGVAVTKKNMLIEQVKAVEAALKEQSELQEKANDVLEQRAEDMGTVAASLAADLERLRRERPTRPSLPPAPRATCSDANGAELDADNASFLRRYASLAAEQQIELNTCRAMYNEARDKLKSQN